MNIEAKLKALRLDYDRYSRLFISAQHEMFVTEQAIKSLEAELSERKEQKAKAKLVEKNKAEAKQVQEQMLKQIAGGNDGSA